MPPAIGGAIFAAAGASGVALGGTVILGTTLATIVGYGVVIGASLALTYALSPDEERQKADGAQITRKQSLPVRVRGYGIHKMAGAYCFMEVFGGTLYQAIMHCEGPIDRFESWHLDDKLAGIAPGALGGYSGVFPWINLIQIESHLGTVPQAASSMILSAMPLFWTSAHRLDGIAYSVFACHLPLDPGKYWQRFYPTGAPELRVTARLSQVFDPRTSTTAWSDNPALCILDYLTHPRGFGLPLARIDTASFSAFANVCDEIVPIVGGSEFRYRLGGVYALSQERRDVLRQLLATCDGEIVMTPAGLIGIRGGKWEAPTVTITEGMVRSYSIEQGNDRFSAFNRLKYSYTSPDHDYQPTEGESWDDLASQALLGVLEQDLPLPFVQRFTQARRLAKIAMAKGNPRWKGTLATSLAALDALGERVVQVNITELGINEPFFITKFEIAGDLSSCQLEISSLDASAYAWNPAEEEGTPPGLPTDPTSLPPSNPTGVTITATGGTGIPPVDVNWTNPSEANFAATQVWRHTSNVVTAALLLATQINVPGSVDTYSDTTPPGGATNVFYWVRAVNSVGTPGSFVASVPASILMV